MCIKDLFEIMPTIQSVLISGMLNREVHFEGIVKDIPLDMFSFKVFALYTTEWDVIYIEVFS